MADVTWNPDDKNANFTLSNGNLTATSAVSGKKSIRATVSKNANKYYWEISVDAGTANRIHTGVANASMPLSYYVGQDANSWGYYSNDGKTYHNGTYASYGDSYTVGDIIGVAIDITAGKMWFSKNGVWQNSGDPVAGTGEAFSGISGDLYPAHCCYWVNTAVTASFMASSFTYSIPSGFTVLGYLGYFSGYVYELGSGVSRYMLLHNRSSGELLDTTTSSGNGYYYLETSYSGTHYIVCLDNDVGEDYNDLVIGNVIPTTIPT